MVRNGFVYEWGCWCVVGVESLKSCMARFLRQANVIERTRLLPGAKEALERYLTQEGTVYSKVTYFSKVQCGQISIFFSLFSQWEKSRVPPKMGRK